MRILVNDQEREVSDTSDLATVAERELGTAIAGVALAVNETVVPRGRWSGHAVRPGDRILIVRAVQGG